MHENLMTHILYIQPYPWQVRTYLTSKSWDTRIAAGQAVEAIAKNVKKWQPSCQANVEKEEKSPSPDADDTLLAFDSFDIRQVRRVDHYRSFINLSLGRHTWDQIQSLNLCVSSVQREKYYISPMRYTSPWQSSVFPSRSLPMALHCSPPRGMSTRALRVTQSTSE